jgi:TRAP-type C4-dicarboxylate transport system permease small subunit
LKVLEIALSLIGAISALFIIIGGFKYVAARGNEEQQEAAKKTLTGAVIGLVFALLAFSIVRIISEIIISGRTGI